MKLSKHAIAMSAMAGFLVAGVTATASEPAPADTGKSIAKDANAMRVVVDPDTGEIRAPDENELRALIEAEKAAAQTQRAARSAAPQASQDVLPASKSLVRHKNGMVSLKLNMDSLSALKVATGADGKAHLVHDGEGTVAPATQAQSAEK